jgi:hypothetical protein
VTFPPDYQFVKWWRLPFWAITLPSPQIVFQIKLPYLRLLQIVLSLSSHHGNSLFPLWELLCSHVGNNLFPLWKQTVSFIFAVVELLDNQCFNTYRILFLSVSLTKNQLRWRLGDGSKGQPSPLKALQISCLSAKVTAYAFFILITHACLHIVGACKQTLLILTLLPKRIFVRTSQLSEFTRHKVVLYSE